jgi:hypothetical protein
MLCAAVGACVAAVPLVAQEKPAAVPPAATETKEDAYAVIKYFLPKPTGYVVEVVNFCKMSQIETRRKELDKGNKKRNDDYEKAKQDALEAKKKFSEPAPKPETLKVIAENIKTEAEAKTLAEKEKKKNWQPPGPADKGDKKGK